MKASFLSNIAHELRMPLASIEGFTETVLRDKDMNEGLRLEFPEIVRVESGPGKGTGISFTLPRSGEGAKC